VSTFTSTNAVVSVFKVCNKHSSKISQETLLNSVSNELLPSMIGQSHDSFTLLCQGCDVISGHSFSVHGVQIGGTLKQT
jgi:hypothetical protein